MQPVADRDRWLALALLVGAILLGYLVLVHPWWTVPMGEAGARIDAMQQRELRARMQLQQADAVARQLQEVQAIEARAPSFLREATAEMAMAGLVQHVEAVVAQASPGNRACAISDFLDAGNLAGVILTPHALEGGTPRLFVDNLSVIAQGFFAMPGGGTSQRDHGLDVEFDVYGYLRPAPGGNDAR